MSSLRDPSALPIIETRQEAVNEGARRTSAPMSCKVLGCASDMRAEPKTHLRFRLCDTHIKAPAILVDGVVSRFCQQCSRFHVVSEFNGNNRTCRTMLEKNRRRQRHPRPEAASMLPAEAASWAAAGSMEIGGEEGDDAAPGSSSRLPLHGISAAAAAAAATHTVPLTLRGPASALGSGSVTTGDSAGGSQNCGAAAAQDAAAAASCRLQPPALGAAPPAFAGGDCDARFASVVDSDASPFARAPALPDLSGGSGLDVLPLELTLGHGCRAAWRVSAAAAAAAAGAATGPGEASAASLPQRPEEGEAEDVVRELGTVAGGSGPSWRSEQAELEQRLSLFGCQQRLGAWLDPSAPSAAASSGGYEAHSAPLAQHFSEPQRYGYAAETAQHAQPQLQAAPPPQHRAPAHARCSGREAAIAALLLTKSARGAAPSFARASAPELYGLGHSHRHSGSAASSPQSADAGGGGGGGGDPGPSPRELAAAALLGGAAKRRRSPDPMYALAGIDGGAAAWQAERAEQLQLPSQHAPRPHPQQQQQQQQQQDVLAGMTSSTDARRAVASAVHQRNARALSAGSAGLAFVEVLGATRESRTRMSGDPAALLQPAWQQQQQQQRLGQLPAQRAAAAAAAAAAGAGGGASRACGSVGADTEEQLHLLLGDLFGPSGPWQRPMDAQVPQPAAQQQGLPEARGLRQQLLLRDVLPPGSGHSSSGSSSRSGSSFACVNPPGGGGPPAHGAAAVAAADRAGVPAPAFGRSCTLTSDVGAPLPQFVGLRPASCNDGGSRSGPVAAWARAGGVGLHASPPAFGRWSAPLQLPFAGGDQATPDAQGPDPSAFAGGDSGCGAEYAALGASAHEQRQMQLLQQQRLLAMQQQQQQQHSHAGTLRWSSMPLVPEAVNAPSSGARGHAGGDAQLRPAHWQPLQPATKRGSAHVLRGPSSPSPLGLQHGQHIAASTAAPMYAED